jgi:signal peptidase II
MKFLFTIIFSIFILDIYTKYLAKIAFFMDAQVIIPNWISFEYVQNTGIAFSLPLPFGWQIFLSIFFLILLGAYAFQFYKKQKSSRYFLLSLGMIYGGALANLYERALFHSVTDFISIWKFPIFNIADIAITLGCVFLYITFIQLEKK